MNLRATLYTIAALAATTHSQTTVSQTPSRSPTTTTTFPLFAIPETRIPITGAQGSVIAANPTATTIFFQCLPSSVNPNTAGGNGGGGDLCMLNSPVTLTEGPSTHSVSAVYKTHTLDLDGSMTLIEDCTITSSTVGAECSVSVSLDLTTPGFGSSASGPASATATETGTGTGSGSMDGVTTTSRSWQTSLGGNDIYYRPLTVTGGMEKLSINTGSPTATMDAGGGRAGNNVGFGFGAAVVAAVVIYV